eukprot:gnl/MRDRNA2_/MRDRNA2_27768_c0_seq1.p1 gnl/MRDRNA2_/MRDRNA2_27768_c0~~gnl/MRDRNA2_/MRDRNA2_27768_c0_seq1.p1  ORF type:complete len:647 (+),score=142.86 gnl/MRDRNA2_/MRDRNA2_27768_c0_seq1:140-1942(+)
MIAFTAGLEILLDDAGKHVHLGTAWKKAEGNCAQAGHAAGFHHNNGVHNEDSFATWNFTVAKDGCYWVEEFHPDTSGCDFNLALQVPLVIDFCKGLQTAGVIDQSQRQGQWNKLVKLPFYVNHSAAISISAKPFAPNFEAAGVWAADAFRLTWDAANCHDPEVQDEAVAPTEEAEAQPPVPVEKEEKDTLPLLQARIHALDSVVLGSTAELVPQCPATAGKHFHHDALQKERRAQATFHFDPPKDGCYLVEELHPQLQECKASSNTKVHINYCKGLEAVGTVDQSVNADQWTFLAALPFFAGHPGNLTLSNEGTEPGTLAVFNQVRFTWSGKSCSQVQAHPRIAEIRLTVDFQHVANRLPEFGIALKSKIAELAKVSETSLRLTELRSGSIIANFLVVPSVLDVLSMAPMDPLATIDKLRTAVEHNAGDLCGLTGTSLEGCQVEFTDLGVAKPSVRPLPRPRAHDQQEQQERAKEEAQPEKSTNIGAVLGIVAAFCVVKIGIYYKLFRSGKKREAYKTEEATQAVQSDVTVALEEGKALDASNAQQGDKSADEKERGDEVADNTSTLAPSSDKQSEPSLNGDLDTKSDLSILKALSNQDI